MGVNRNLATLVVRGCQLQYLLDNKYTKEQAIAILSNTDKYKKTDDTKSDTDKTKEDVKK